jgi:predicted dehydrogenase
MAEYIVISVAILGLGRVGSCYDAANDGPPRSHIGAVLSTTALRLSLLIDPDPQARAACRTQWGERIAGVPIVAAAEAAPCPVDVVAICAPVEGREAQLNAALTLGPRLVIIEKPMASALPRAEAMAKRLEDANVAVRVNFHRRFDTRFVRTRAELPGLPQRVVFRYGKGLLNYGSHIIDLLLDWFGPIEKVQAVGFETAPVSDPSTSFVCRMAAGFDATALGFSGVDYDLFEGEFYFADRVLALMAGGAKWTRFTPVTSLYYPGYAHLAEDEAARDIGQVGGLGELYQALSSHLHCGTPLAGCDAASALAGMAVLDAVQQSVRQCGAPISLLANTASELRENRS